MTTPSSNARCELLLDGNGGFWAEASPTEPMKRCPGATRYTSEINNPNGGSVLRDVCENHATLLRAPDTGPIPRGSRRGSLARLRSLPAAGSAAEALRGLAEE